MSDLDPLKDEVRSLPQSDRTWLVVFRRLRTWLQEGDEVVQPWTMLCLTRSASKIIGNEILLERPSQKEALETLFGFMLEPAPGSLPRPQRPSKIVFEDPELSEISRQGLHELDIRASHGDAPDVVNLILADFEGTLRGEGEEEIPGLLEVEGVTPKLVSEFFAAAADFYRAEPWIEISNEQTLAVSFPPDEQVWYVTVMGQGGVEYGLILQRTWEQVERLFHKLDDPIGGMPSEGWHSVSFEPPNLLPFADLEAIERYGWEVAGEEAYPLPAIFDHEHALRPPGDELALWVPIMRAVPAFVENHLIADGAGDHRPAEADIEVASASGTVTARVRYPAGELDRAQQAYRSFPRESQADDEPPMPDRRALEGMLMDLAGAFDDPNLEQAQRVMYDAWDTQDRGQRIHLAERALAHSPDCADAYVLLAEEKAQTVGEALEYFRKGVEAGEAALGPRTFEEDVGHFWGLLPTRPYMRARYGLANCLWELNRAEEAEGHYRDLLRLNPSDNQGVRYTLLRLLIETGRDEAALQFLEEHGDDASAAVMYNRALLLYRLSGGDEAGEAALEEALDWNPYVPAYLLGRKRVPRDMPLAIGVGDESEAVDYAASYLNPWRATPGALDWLQDHIDESDG